MCSMYTNKIVILSDDHVSFKYITYSNDHFIQYYFILVTFALIIGSNCACYESNPAAVVQFHYPIYPGILMNGSLNYSENRKKKMKTGRYKIN